MTLVVYFSAPRNGTCCFSSDTRIFQEGYCPEYPQKKGAPFSAPPDKIFFIDLEPSRFFNLKRSNANLMAVGKDIYIVTARDECSVIIPVNGHIDFIVHIIYRSPGRVNNLLPLVFE